MLHNKPYIKFSTYRKSTVNLQQVVQPVHKNWKPIQRIRNSPRCCTVCCCSTSPRHIELVEWSMDLRQLVGYDKRTVRVSAVTWRMSVMMSRWVQVASERAAAAEHQLTPAAVKQQATAAALSSACLLPSSSSSSSSMRRCDNAAWWTAISRSLANRRTTVDDRPLRCCCRRCSCVAVSSSSSSSSQHYNNNYTTTP